MSVTHFSDKGMGQPIVFIHGFCEIGAMWDAIAYPLASDFHIFCPDLPGFGKSPMASNHITLEEVAVQLEEWMEEQKIENPIVIGHSLGGYVALALLELMGNRIKGLGLIHSTALADDEEKKNSRNKTITFVKKHGVDKFVTAFVPQLFTASTRTQFEKEIDLTVTQSKESSLIGLIAYSKAMRDRKSRIQFLWDYKGPKLLIAGTEDSVVKIEESRLQKDAFTAYHELAGIGHMGHVEQKEAVIEILSKFMTLDSQ
jgi:pimeloyl-ACP methyl ester carboxylesterase